MLAVFSGSMMWTRFLTAGAAVSPPCAMAAKGPYHMQCWLQPVTHANALACYSDVHRFALRLVQKRHEQASTDLQQLRSR